MEDVESWVRSSAWAVMVHDDDDDDDDDDVVVVVVVVLVNSISQ